MRNTKKCLLYALIGFVLCGAQAARADTPVVDPGFSYVDVNNDGMYSASDGDIQIPSGLITDGKFDTGKSEPGYTAPCQPASLVIPASQNLNVVGNLTLKAGVNIIINGTLAAPSITLDAGKNIDLTTASITVENSLNVDAGKSGCGSQGDAILTGVTITGTSATSTVKVQAEDIIGNQITVGTNTLVAAVEAGASITLKASDKVALDGAALFAFAAPTTTTPGGAIKVTGKDVSVVDFSSLFSEGKTTVSAGCGDLDFSTSSATGSSISLSADGDVNIQGSALDSAGKVTVKACGQVTGSASTAINAGSLTVDGDCGVDLSDVAVISSPDAISIQSCGGAIKLDGASIITAGGLAAHSYYDLSFTGLSLLADHYAKFRSNCGAITGNNSSIRPFTAALTDTYLSVKAEQAISATSVDWVAPASITVHSNCGNVDLTSSTLSATGLNAPLNLYAGGGTLILTGSTLTGVLHIGPSGVNVIH